MKQIVLENRRRVVLALGALPLARLAGAADIELARTGGPYVPTPQVVVDEMLRMAKVGSDDFVVDLGSGDGIIVLTAAQRLNARGFGVDIDPGLVKLSNGEARKRGVADRAVFHEMDVHKADISKATVVTLYLLPGMMESLRPKLLKELRPGTRIVSHDFDFGEWKPDRSVEVKTDEKYEITGNWTSTVHLWTVPAAVQGAWRGSLAGGQGGAFQLEVTQRYQQFEGRLTRDAEVAVLKDGQIDGSRIRFVARGPDGRLQTFTGTVNEGHMSGEAHNGGRAEVARWSAARVQ